MTNRAQSTAPSRTPSPSYRHAVPCQPAKGGLRAVHGRSRGVALRRTVVFHLACVPLPVLRRG
eukprot:7628655-Pyramimonas_sp.AAC.1